MSTQGFGVTTTELDLTFDLHGHSSVDNISQLHELAQTCVQAVKAQGQTDRETEQKTRVLEGFSFR